MSNSIGHASSWTQYYLIVFLLMLFSFFFIFAFSFLLGSLNMASLHFILGIAEVISFFCSSWTFFVIYINCLTIAGFGGFWYVVKFLLIFSLWTIYYNIFVKIFVLFSFLFYLSFLDSGICVNSQI